MRPKVSALLVSHDGAPWLPAVLDALQAQTSPPDRVIAVDTGSTDAGPELLADRLGPDAVHHLPADTGFGAAVTQALDRTAALDEAEWVWLLHDDSAPAPDALERLLEAATLEPGVDVLGPKLREWPSLRRLLEVGVTLSGTGRRETGLERGEYDQGQHDQRRQVLAVNTAGMLVRRSVLEQLGFDPHLPVLGADLDFGWRAARAGHRTLTVPEAIVFHVEAAARGRRVTPLTGRRVRRTERRAALHTMLTNCSAAALPFLVLRLLLGSVLRALGLLLLRAPREAFDELAAVAATYARPLRIWKGRRSRARAAVVSARDVRPLLAPPWLPYRHGLDVLTEAGTALARQAGDAATARRARLREDGTALEAAETGPVPAEAQNLPADTGLVARWVTNPVALALAGLLVLALWSARGRLGGGLLSGGALLPAPDSAFDWWATYLSAGHDLGTGSTAPAAPYLLPLAALGTVLLAKAWLVLDVLLLLAVPLAAAGGYRFLLRLTGSRAAALWGAMAYGLLPVLTGAVGQGRVGTVAAALLLPWLAHSALFLGPDETVDRRRRAAWRTTLWLALVSAFAPLAWLMAAVVTVLVLVLGMAGAIGPAAAWRRPATWLPVAVPVLVSPVLLLPWTVATWSHQGFASLLTEAGLSAPSLVDALGWTDIVFARPGGSAPWWLGIGVVLAAVAALVRTDRRRPVLAAWLVLVVALVTTAALSRVEVALASEPVAHPLWLGLPLLVAQAAAVTAAAVAGSGIAVRLSGASFGWRQPLGAAVVVLALLSPLAGVLWWTVSGTEGPLDRRPLQPAPPYMIDAAAQDPSRGVLVVRGSDTGGYTYLLLRDAGLRLGDESVLPPVDEQQPLTEVLGRLATAPEPEDVTELQGYGVGFVYAPAPADPELAGNLDSVSGLTRASAIAPGSRAWQLAEPAANAAPVTFEQSAARPWLLLVQGLALVAVAVLAAPTRRVTR
ncbi:glycosyltransferase family 2 protein [Nocardioides mesophilus]|uniref:Glycosyltransferase family 2 protein n=1 Tax=Nocardioides mesophilus TaxID=433659 RepID=A0A7G9RDE7_9ACTN|nr:glycosyltransferase family 2 protein [Nocardioides mesophilus]QNN53622.1 glycosyltransferase family 2 protein [Nocardioides mesophilus]